MMAMVARTARKSKIKCFEAEDAVASTSSRSRFRSQSRCKWSPDITEFSPGRSKYQRMRKNVKKLPWSSNRRCRAKSANPKNRLVNGQLTVVVESSVLINDDNNKIQIIVDFNPDPETRFTQARTRGNLCREMDELYPPNLNAIPNAIPYLYI